MSYIKEASDLSHVHYYRPWDPVLFNPGSFSDNPIRISGKNLSMKKFFDSRRELVSVGPGSGGGGGSSGVGGNFIGRTFTIGHHQVTVEETLAEGQDDRSGVTSEARV